MKKIIITAFLFFNTLTGSTQFKTQQFVDSIPTLPVEGCKTNIEDRTAFLNKVSNQLKQIDEQIKKMKRETRPDENYARNEAISQMATQYGLSEEQVNKMKNKKKMSAEEKAGIADTMLQQQTNISMAELKNISKMTPEGRKAWAQAYGGEAYVMSQGNQSNNQQKNGKSAAELTMQLQNLSTAVMQREMDIQKQYNEIENNPERLIALEKIHALNSRFTSMGGQDNGQGQQMDSIAVLIKKEKESYCEKYTTQYWNVLSIQYNNLKASYSDYIRLADLRRAVTNMQPVHVNLPTESAIEYFNYIKDYLIHLSAAFNYLLN